MRALYYCYKGLVRHRIGWRLSLFQGRDNSRRIAREVALEVPGAYDLMCRRADVSLLLGGQLIETAVGVSWKCHCRFLSRGLLMLATF